MLDLIDQSIESFFRAAVPLSATDIDMSFEPPDRQWSAKLIRPTVNAFLWDIRKSTARARTGMEEVERNGHTVRRLALPVIELRYIVTAWTSDHGDERALLGGLMRSILRHSDIPRTYLPDGLAEVRPPSLLMARTGEEHVDVFKALEGQLKPGINMIITAEVDIDRDQPIGPEVGGVSISVADLAGGATTTLRRVAGEVVLDGDGGLAGAVGAVVRGQRHATYVNPAGRFLIDAQAGETLVLEVDPPRSVTVPASGGVRFR